MLGVETSHRSFLTSTPDTDKRAIQAQGAGWDPVLFWKFWRRKKCREILVEKRATKVLYVFDLCYVCHTFRPSHLPWLEHPK